MIFTQSAGSPGEPFQRVTPEVAATRVSECGLGPVTIRFDDLLQSIILTAASAGAVTDAPLSCADRAVSYYDLELPPAVQPRYDALREKRLSAHFVAEARAWLSARGLIDRVPHYQPGVTDDADFTRAVESLCGPRAKGAFQSQYGFHVISPDWVKRSLSPIDEEGSEMLACILNVTSVAGYKVGLIRNEAFAEDKPGDTGSSAAAPR